MAYLAFAEHQTAGAPAAISAMPVDIPDGFSGLEWSVVALARRDGLATLDEPGRIAIALGSLFGERASRRLADPRLEALRRTAVLAWHHGFALPVSQVKAFVAAGFTTAQLETLLASIGAGRLTRRRRG